MVEAGREALYEFDITHPTEREMREAVGVRHTVLRSSAEGEFGLPDWTSDQMRGMDARFHKRLLAAIEAGAERCATSVSTSAGTRFPIYNYKDPEGF